MLRARLVRSLHGVAASLLYCTVHQTLPLLATLDRQGRLVVVDGDRDRHRVLAGTISCPRLRPDNKTNFNSLQTDHLQTWRWPWPIS